MKNMNMYYITVTILFACYAHAADSLAKKLKDTHAQEQAIPNDPSFAEGQFENPFDHIIEEALHVLEVDGEIGIALIAQDPIFYNIIIQNFHGRGEPTVRELINLLRDAR